MKKTPDIITIGLSPCWDVTCYTSGWRWNSHRSIARQEIRPAGKALNVSRVLAELGTPNRACGLWGDKDYSALLHHIKSLQPTLKCQYTLASGHTRTNVTLIETHANKETHLRAPDPLADTKTLHQLQKDLRTVIQNGTVCIFAGSMPSGSLLNHVLDLLQYCRQQKAQIVVDSSGVPFKTIVNSGSTWMIKPNVDELRELIGRPVKDTPAALAKAAIPLLAHVKHILVSRGNKGALLVTAKGCWIGKANASKKPVLSTVACGDYLLAGFLHKRLHNHTHSDSLKTALQVATLHAWGYTKEKYWPDELANVNVSIRKLTC